MFGKGLLLKGSRRRILETDALGRRPAWDAPGLAQKPLRRDTGKRVGRCAMGMRKLRVAMALAIITLPGFGYSGGSNRAPGTGRYDEGDPCPNPDCKAPLERHSTDDTLYCPECGQPAETPSS